MNLKTSLVRAMLVAALAPVAALAQTVVYETGFETTGDPSGSAYTAGSLNGQGVVSGRFGGWTVEGAGLASVVSGPLTPQSGGTYVEQGANSTIVASVTSNSPRMLVRAYHNGAGATVPAAPDPGVPAAAVIAFKSVDANNYTVDAWNGAAFVEPGSPVNLTVGNWNEVLLSLNYGLKEYDMQVNGAPYLQELGFADNTISQFNGFRSSTTVGSNIDTVSFHASAGDYDGDGRKDDLEMRMNGGNPLDADTFPNFGDVNGDGDVNLLDALLMFRAIMVPGFPTVGLTLYDINDSGAITADDARDLFGFVTGDASVPYLPSN